MTQQLKNRSLKLYSISIALIVFLLISFSKFALAEPSFDCKKAKSQRELLICSDTELSHLDWQLADAFSKILKAFPAASKEIKFSQLEWVKAREATYCGESKERQKIINCLKEVYNHRIKELNSKSFIACIKNLKDHKVTVTCQAPNTPENLSFVLTGIAEEPDVDASFVKLKKIAILSDTKIIQELPVEGEIWNSGVNQAIELLDINFDGKLDIKLWTATSAGPNSGYDYFIYKSDISKFQASDLHDKLSGMGLEIDTEKKTLTTSNRMNCCSWAFDTYHWVNNELALKTNLSNGALSLIELDALLHGSNIATDPDRERQEICGSITINFNDDRKVASTEISVDEELCKSDTEMNPKTPTISEIKKYLEKFKNADRFSISQTEKNKLLLIFEPPHANNFN